MNILVLGGVSYDTLIHLDELPEPVAKTIFPNRVIKSIGSTGAGKAIPLAKLGFDVTFHAMIGDDQIGRDITQTLNKEKIHFIYDIDPKGTETHTNLMANDGKRISIFTNPLTFEPTIDETKINEAIEKADFVLMNIKNYTRRFIDKVKACDKPLWIDIHDYDGRSEYHQDYIKAADILFMSKDLIEDPTSFVKDMLLQGKQAVVVTDGPNGITGYYSDDLIHMPAIKPSKQGDFNGAGDHVVSGYLFGFVHQMKRKDCLKAGVILATSCIESDTLSNDEISMSWLKSKLA